MEQNLLSNGPKPNPDQEAKRLKIVALFNSIDRLPPGDDMIDEIIERGGTDLTADEALALKNEILLEPFKGKPELEEFMKQNIDSVDRDRLTHRKRSEN